MSRLSWTLQSYGRRSGAGLASWSGLAQLRYQMTYLEGRAVHRGRINQHTISSCAELKICSTTRLGRSRVVARPRSYSTSPLPLSQTEDPVASDEDEATRASLLPSQDASDGLLSLLTEQLMETGSQDQSTSHSAMEPKIKSRNESSSSEHNRIHLKDHPFNDNMRRFLWTSFKKFESDLLELPSSESFGRSKVLMAKKLSQFGSDLLRCSRMRQPPERVLSLFEDHETNIYRSERSMNRRLMSIFLDHELDHYFTASDRRLLESLSSLQNPGEWYSAARAMNRVIHLHIGPTNSGKTHHALKRLEAASTGVYAGPLKLLAQEVHKLLNAKGKPCNLVVGDERSIDTGPGPGAGLTSATVEMLSLNHAVEVAVIDEIQMLGDRQRGWSFTQALLGVKAKEVHICGEPRVLPLVRDIANSLGEELVIHEYNRLNPLKVMETSLDGRLENLRKGDCLVCFTRVKLREMKDKIESGTGKKCAMIYGALPPSTRTEQANLFNDPSNDYDYLVASDAIGMGLNLLVKRIVFQSVQKYGDGSFGFVETARLKQIAGRAGRYRTSHQNLVAAKTSTPYKPPTNPGDSKISRAEEDAEFKLESEPEHAISTGETDNIGWVTTFRSEDLPYLTATMSQNLTPLTAACIRPTFDRVVRYASIFPPETPFTYIIARMFSECRLDQSGRFSLGVLGDTIALSQAIQPIANLSNLDRIVLCSAPYRLNTVQAEHVFRSFAEIVAREFEGDLLDIPHINFELLDQDLDDSDLQGLEQLYLDLSTYAWLSFRFPASLRCRSIAMNALGRITEKIEGIMQNKRSTNDAKLVLNG